MLSFVVKILLWSTSLGAAAARRRLTSSDYLNQYRDHATSRFILKTDDKIDELSVMPIKVLFPIVYGISRNLTCGAYAAYVVVTIL